MKKACRKCKTQFDVTDKHLAFYEKVSPQFLNTTYRIPPPTLCPQCREQRRMSWRSERNLFVRQCSKTGQRMVSMYVPNTEFPVYEGHEWWAEENDALDYGRDIDFSRPIFPQIRELQSVVPRMQMFTYALDRMENSEFTNCTGDLKNCYMIFCSGRNERCYYSTAIQDSFQCMDCYYIQDCTNCYECINIDSCNTLFFSQSCRECADSALLFDCRGCANCLCCAGLRRKQYHFLNKPLSETEYQKVKSEMFSGSSRALSEARKAFEKLLLDFSRRYIHGDKNENTTGDFVSNTKNCNYCFDTHNAEDCSFCTWFIDGRDCMDFYSWGESELCYEISGGGDAAYQMLFSASGSGLRYCLYTDLCQYCKECFACVGLKNKRNCILNKQYSKRDYEELAAKLVEHMIETGEWGEFFPSEFAPFGYNHSAAAEYYPLSREQARAQGFLWSDYESQPPEVSRVLQSSQVSDSILEVSEDILDCALVCEKSGKLFRVLKDELEFYRNNSLPIPRVSSNERHLARVARRNPRKLWTRKCSKCEGEIITSYSPECPEEVFCEKCYNQSIY